MEYRHLIKHLRYQAIWRKSYGNEIGRLFQGMPGRVKGTNTAYFIHSHEIPSERWQDVTYERIVTAYEADKAEPNHTRLTVGGL